MEAMLRTAGVEIGIVTDGRWWALVCARRNAMVASGIVDALTWVEEPLTRNAFLTVIGRQYLVGGDPNERLPVLFAESVAAAEEITEALGVQVRRAVELLIQAFAETAAESRRRGARDPLPADPREAYSAAVTVMMRVVFLLFAEERGLLPQSRLFQQGYGLSGELDALEQRVLVEGEESLDSTYLTWHRLLATSQALYRGASFENLRMPAYGGSLFDPDQHPFLTEPGDHGTLAMPVSDRVMLHVLRSVQVAQLRGGDARRISFRDIDVEQIGYIYEGLLGYTCTRVTGIQVGLAGGTGAEPEVPLTVLERLDAERRTPAALAAAILAWVKENQAAAVPKSATALTKLLASEPTEAHDRQLRAVTADDDALRERLRRWATITRPDLRGRPTVVLDGGLLVTETPSRRNAGAHYTPKSLAEEVVRHALEPLCYLPGPHQTADAATWRLRGSDEILALKVADIAAGSGAFLVAAARYLGDRLVEAWTAEDPANAHRHDLHQHAVREVVARCLYGADINAMAVEMCKLSLWLVSLDRDLPFSFVDDKILHGNSLLGITDLEQLRALHIDPSASPQPRLSTLDMDHVVQRAIAMRRELASEVQEYDPQRSAAAKRRLLDRLHSLTAQLRAVADGVIAAGLRLGGKPGRALNEAYENLAEAVASAFPPAGEPGDPAFLDSIVQAGLKPTVATDFPMWRAIHWVLEVPDVLVERGGFDAIVGNPPFVAGSDISGAFGANHRDWLVSQVANGKRGTADLVAYFFLRAHSILRRTGNVGLIATNTIAQGVTRKVGLDQLIKNGLAITRAVQSEKWTGASASVVCAKVWGTFDTVNPDAEKIVDGLRVGRITTLLEPEGRVSGDPVSLVQNANLAFEGIKHNGAGFIILPAVAAGWMAQDGRNGGVLRPFANGDDLNSRPDLSASRWIIDFSGMTERDASRYALPFRHIEMYVKPERSENGNPKLREFWWLYERPWAALRVVMRRKRELIAMVGLSKTLMPMLVSTRQLYSNSVTVFAMDSYADLAVLSSSLHQLWVIKYGSDFRRDPRYTPSNTFEGFPRPSQSGELSAIGSELDGQRTCLMARREIGMTALYAQINDPQLGDADDPDIARMRRIHVELDRAIMAAFGWEDVPLEHGFHTYRQMMRWTVSPAARVEILDRLLVENLRRAAAQPKKAGKGRRGAARTTDDAQGTLL